MPTLVLTGHIMEAPRRASMLFLAEAMAARGVPTHVITAKESWLSWCKKEKPWKRYHLNTLTQLSPTLSGYIWFPLFHPFNLKKSLLNRLATPLFRLYPYMFPLKKLPFTPNMVMVESGLGLFMVPQLKKAFPKATFIYNVADRLETLNTHPLLLKAEKEALPHFHHIRVPAQAMLKDYPNLPAHWIPHGLDKTLFDKPHPNPYPSKGHHVVSVGDMLFDSQAIKTLAQKNPQSTFHLFGAKAKLETPLPNVIEYGEKPFASIVPYIQHAHMGLAPYRPAPHVEYLAQSSLKLIQYTYCKLPVVAPHFATMGQSHIKGYTPHNPNSIQEAFEAAMKIKAKNITTQHIQTWPEVLQSIEKNLP